MVQTYPESSYLLKTQEQIHDYLIGGKGIVTLKSPSGRAYTYAFNSPRDPKADFPEGTLFIYVQRDHGNWLYLGMIDKTKHFRLTYASHAGSDSRAVKGAIYLVDRMFGRNTDTRMEVYHQGICSVCGRRLTHYKSILCGIGPKCKRRLKHGLQR